MTRCRIIAATLAGNALTAHAAQTPSPATSAGGFFQVLIGLIVVLALMAAVAWLLKRFNLAKITGNAPVKIVGGVSVGNRERVIVVEVADQWIVVGVASGQVNALSTLPRPITAESTLPVQAPATNNFALWLKQKIDKRNAQ